MAIGTPLWSPMDNGGCAFRVSLIPVKASGMEGIFSFFLCVLTDKRKRLLDVSGSTLESHACGIAIDVVFEY